MKQKIKVYDYATAMNISVPTVYRRIKSGKIQTETIDGVLYVLLDDKQPDNTQRHDNEKDDNESENDVITQLQACLNLQQAEIEQLQQELLQVQTRVDWLSKQLATGWAAELKSTEFIMLQRTDFRSNDKSQSRPDD